VRSLKRYYLHNEEAFREGYQVFESMPTSFILTAKCRDKEYYHLITRYNDLNKRASNKERLPLKHCEENIWLLKPACMNQGRGIEVCHTLKGIKDVLESKMPNTVMVAQKYVEKPLLYHGRKFDIRVWAIATAKQEFYYYKHGYLRTSSAEYDTQGKDNYIHLTNNCLQKYGDAYGAHEAGNTLSFQDFQRYLDSQFPQYNVSVDDHLVPRMKDLMIDAYLSAKDKLLRGKRMAVFELLGFDFLIDEDFRVWLIEVNTNPYLGVPNQFIEKLLPKMIDDMIAITVDPYYTPQVKHSKNNDFIMLYNDSARFSTRRPFNTPVYPIPELARTPLYKESQKSEPVVKEFEDSIDNKAKTKIVLKDILETVKEMLTSPLYLEVQFYRQIIGRIMSSLTNWELMSEEQLLSATQALRLLSTTPAGLLSLVMYNHIPNLLQLCFSENIPHTVQYCALETLLDGIKETKFRKEVLVLGVCEHIINMVLSLSYDKPIQKIILSILLTITDHPTKNAYIPGETREHNWMRKSVINEGLLVCLFKLSQEAEEKVKEQVQKHIEEEFSLADWEYQVAVLEGNLHANKMKKNPRLRSISADEHQKAKKPLTPKLNVLQNHGLMKYKQDIEYKCWELKERNRQKLEEDRVRRQQEVENQQKVREEEEREKQERRKRAEEEMIRRYSVLKKRINDENKKEEAEASKISEEKKLLLLHKKKQQEIAKRTSLQKKKQLEQELKEKMEAERQELLEKRRKAMEEWIKQKAEIEKEKKLLKSKKETLELKRLESRSGKDSSLKHININRSPSCKTEIIEEKPQANICSETLYSPNLDILKESASRLPIHPRADDITFKWKFQKHKNDDRKRKKGMKNPEKFMFNMYFPQRKKKPRDSSISLS
jgi:hypothetical protein